jgi:integral membrane sensor domain MASE1
MAQLHLPAAGSPPGTPGGPPLVQRAPWWRQALLLLLLAAAYYVLAQGNLLLSNFLGSATLFWPPGGLALAALLLWGPRCWPGVALGALLVIGSTQQGWPFVLLAVAGNTVFPLLAAWGLRRWFPGAARLGRVRDAIAFVSLGAVAGPLGSSAVGLVALASGGQLQAGHAAYQWLHWWLGDVLGVLLIAPPVIAWARAPLKRIKRRQLLAPQLLLLLTIVLLTAVFGSWWSAPAQHLPLAFLLLPLIAWAALHFGLRGATALNLVICLTAVWSTDQGFGPFALIERNVTNEYVWLFIAVCCLTALFIGTAVEAQRRLVRELERALAEVHELKGLLPICAKCKKIRDDQGYWQSVEGYISERTAAQFTHSLCPACVAILYPDLDLDLPGAKAAS